MSDPKRKYYNNQNRWRKKKKKNDNDNDKEKRSKNNNNHREKRPSYEANSNSTGDQCTPDASTPSNSDQPRPRIARRDTPYSGWDLYFEGEEYKKSSPIIPKVRTMEKLLENNPEMIAQISFTSTFNIDVNLLYNSNIFTENWPDFKSELRNNPQFVLNCLGLAIHKIRSDLLEEANETIDLENPNAIVRVKILNYEPIVSLKNIKVSYYNKLISVRGCVIRVNRSCHMPTVLVLLCNKCKLPYTVKQKNGIYTLKKKCDICGGMKFEPDLSSAYTETIPIQVVRIQEHFGEQPDDQGRVPRVMDIELYEELVDTCMPGDDVTITGIIKMEGTDNGKLRTNPVSNLYIEAVSVVNNNTKTKNSGGFSIELSSSDYRSIKDIHQYSDVLSLLVHSLCPGIYGHEMIKMSLLLSLFGGSTKHANLRDNIHILIVGDPGLGKSQMLQACSRVAPKGIYVSGNSSSSSGLTVTLVRESGQNDFALEPGALVLADRGCCCIDEFDKMPTQHQALLEAMEQQSVSVAKSGVIWSLPSRTSILAAANPIGGRYDKGKALNRNLNMSQPLLSRFDIVFLLLDQPDKDLDNFLSGHVMLMHTGNEITKNEDFVRYNKDNGSQVGSLMKQLVSISRNAAHHTVPPAVLRKYIAYARQYVKPKLSSASASILQRYYLGLRKNVDTASTLSPCNRQLEALIRLTEARAKLDLREETTEQDALDVVELMQHTVMGDNNNKTDYTFITSSKASKSSVKSFLRILVKDAEGKNNYLYSKDELKKLTAKGGITGGDALKAIDQLNEQGFLIKKSNDLYKFCAP